MSQENYSLQKPGRFIDNLALRKRLHMLQMFLHAFPEQACESVLDVGVTADIHALSSNYFEKYYPKKEKIIALSNQDATFLQDIYPGITFWRGDARELPFADNSIDVIFSSAVIEHVGSLTQQKKMLAECFRVAKQGVFITTPNRWHPVEIHTLLPLLHWLPKSLHRTLLKCLGLTFYSQEENLNLMDRKSLSTLCQELGIQNFSIRGLYTLGFTSNLVLVIKK